MREPWDMPPDGSDSFQYFGLESVLPWLWGAPSSRPGLRQLASTAALVLWRWLFDSRQWSLDGHSSDNSGANEAGQGVRAMLLPGSVATNFPPPPLAALAAIAGESPVIMHSTVTNGVDAAEGAGMDDLFEAAAGAANLGSAEPNEEAGAASTRAAGRRGVRDASVFRAEWMRLVRRYSRAELAIAANEGGDWNLYQRTRETTAAGEAEGPVVQWLCPDAAGTFSPTKPLHHRVLGEA